MVDIKKEQFLSEFYNLCIEYGIEHFEKIEDRTAQSSDEAYYLKSLYNDNGLKISAADMICKLKGK